MKKAYMRPDINAQAYAQFENVYTGCDKNPGWIQNGKNVNCHFAPQFHPSDGPGFDAHGDLAGPTS